MRSVLLFLLLPTLALAQSPTPHPEDVGTVTGHVTCADTQRPARLAIVRLIPLRTPTTGAPESSNVNVGSGIIGPAVHTDLTGSYTMAGVEPGQYYLRIDLPGYATPISQFTVDDLKSPTPEVEQRIQHELQLVTVAPNSTVQADATIHRGGSISGTVTFDDGSPAISIGVGLLRRDANGKLQAVRRGNAALTNGRGQFFIESLSPGEYVIEARLTEFERNQTTDFENGRPVFNPAEMATSVLPVYSGNVYRQKDSTAIKVDLGQESNGDISLPLGQLHEISGTLLAKDSHPINSGRIELLDPDTREQVAATYTNDEGAFRFRNVPEGNYILTVTKASDMTAIEIHEAPNHTATVSRRTLHTYGNLSQPLTVQTDIQSLILTVPEKPTATASK